MGPEEINLQGKLIEAVFTSWDANQVEFVVLRNYANLPYDVGNDLDILVRPEQMKQAEVLLISAAATCGFDLLNKTVFCPVCIHLYHRETLQQIHIDLFKDIRWRVFDIILSGQILSSRIPRGTFYTPSLEHEAFVNLLGKLLYQNRVREKYHPLIQAAVETKEEFFASLLRQAFGVRTAREMLQNIRMRNWPAVEKLAPQLRRKMAFRQMAFSGGTVLKNLFSDVIRLLKRYRVSPGVFVVLIGPDGCGKSSISEGIQNGLNISLKKDKSRVVHWKPRVFSTPKDASGAGDPHGQVLRGRVGSVLFFCCHWAEFFLGYWKVIKPVVFRNGMVIVERYYYDFFVDQKRFRLNVPGWIVKAGFVFVKKPDMVFCMDAEPEILQARKKEVSFEETQRQRNAYRALVQKLPNGHVIDASRPLEKVVRDVEQIILQFMAARTVGRYSAER